MDLFGDDGDDGAELEKMKAEKKKEAEKKQKKKKKILKSRVVFDVKGYELGQDFEALAGKIMEYETEGLKFESNV